MNVLNKRSLIYASNTTAAALAAVWISCSWNLLNPGWAALTVFICSQPMTGVSGAVTGRALHRLAGTAAGCAASLLIVPAFADVPELLFGAVALWVGTCVFLSLLEKGPRSYAFLLAGYTVGLVALPQANAPANLFDVLLARVEEVAIGAGCAAVAHALLLPTSVGELTAGKAAALVEQARRTILQTLDPAASPSEGHAGRMRLAQALGELRLLVGNLHFDLARGYTASSPWHAMEERLVAITALLSAMAERLPALEARADAWPPIASLRTRLADWIGGEAATHPDALGRLDQAKAALLPAPGVLPAREEAVVVNGVERADELARHWHDLVLLSNAVQGRGALPSWAGRVAERRLHVDAGMAFFVGASVAVTVLIAAGLVLLVGWQQGLVAVGIAMTGTSVFAFLDDPRPALLGFLIASLIALPIGAAYVFAILPAVDDLPALAMVLAPLYFVTSLFVASPKHGLLAHGFALTSQTFIALQVAGTSDFTAFSSLAIGSISGSVIGLVATSLLRVVSPAASSRRILAVAREELRGLAAGREDDRAAWASRMLDRATLLFPRLRGASDHPDLRAAFADLRLGVNLMELRDASRSLQAEVLPALDHALSAVSRHVQGGDGDRLPAESRAATVQAVDGAIEALAALDDGPLRTRALAAAAGLRSSLQEGAAPVPVESP